MTQDNCTEIKPHKIMTPEEYSALKIEGWHQVYKDYDGFGAVAICYVTPTPPADMEGAVLKALQKQFNARLYKPDRGVSIFEGELPEVAQAIVGAVSALQRAVPPLMVMKEDGTIERVPDVPDGWQLVPKEPTEPMLRGARDKAFWAPVDYASHYRAMLSAAPVLADDRSAK